ncbi:hypothetical protein HHK36_010090 [Tetracentron sinense]|uniref:Carbohydrate kinase PfkB domain-containing protein n=1 Tax=Tetracentron sinense TaxID=13715 RepID=A0A834ZGX8_TETSI|nr:hypothetical protein HHK36_010090 [Tetracentron sinense]
MDFRDDLFLFSRANSQLAEGIKDLLSSFVRPSASTANFHKSAIFFAATSRATRSSITNTMGMTEGRSELIKSVLNGSSMYWCSVFKLPQAMIYKLEQIMSRFLWAGSDSKTTIHKVGGCATQPILLMELEAIKRGLLLAREKDNYFDFCDFVFSTVESLCGCELEKKAGMENSVRRRLEALSRHLFLQCEADQALNLIFLRGNQLKHMESEPVIIGGMVLDIHAAPSIPVNPRTTTPGKVHYVTGGVARNVAECMSKLGTKPYMISAIGLDIAGDLLLEHWKSAGLSTEGIRKHQDIQTAVVCNLFDANGELAAAVASVEAIEKFLTPEWIQQFRCNICSAPALMIDANLNPRSLEASCQIAAEFGIPVWFEPVSVAKSKRIASVVNYITFTSPNEDELVAMANALSCGDEFHPVQRDNSRSMWSAESSFKKLKHAIWVLLEKGIEVVVVTLGSDGVFLCSRGGPALMKHGLKKIKPSSFGGRLHEIVASSCPSNRFVCAANSEGSSHHLVVHFPALPASVVRLTGAGDCLVGGILASLCAGLDMMQSMAVGIAAAKAAVETETNVPSQFCLARIADDARRVYSAANVMFHQSMM